MVIYIKLLQLIMPGTTTCVEINIVTTTTTVQNGKRYRHGELFDFSSSSLLLGNLHCFLCTECDVKENLIAAGTYQASKKKVNLLHLQQLGEKWLNWALCLESYKHVITALSVGEVTSN